MCGICGIYGPHYSHNLQAMMTTLQHRGPDGSDHVSDGTCSLGHRRLAIIDLTSKGLQPIHNEYSTVFGVVNGEVYNYKEIRNRLESRGHWFYSRSDSEVVVHLYEEYGDSFMAQIRGMFALAIYDTVKKKLVIARDLVGKKPLYYHYDGDRLLFASEIKALLAAGAPRNVNYEAIPSWLKYQYSVGDSTLFLGIKKIPAAHYLTISPEEGPTLHKYWYSLEPSGGRSLRDILRESTKLRMQSDVPIGAFLSGGIDSSAVVALYREQYSGPLHTFTATFEGHSEAEYARMVGGHLEVTYHEVPITGAMVAKDLERITWHHDEPLGDAAIVNNYYLARDAKKYVTVVLAGEGGDELFGGYPWYQYAPILNCASLLPSPIRNITRAISPGGVSGYLYTAGRLLGLLSQTDRASTLMYPTTAMSDKSIEWLLAIRLDYPKIDLPDVQGTYNQMLALDLFNLLPEKFLMKADKGTMAWAIEERLPILDQEVVRYSLTAPEALKRHKVALRRAVEDLLPEEIVWRPKKGFGTPVSYWLHHDLRGRLVNALSEGRLIRDICFKRSVASLISTIDEGRGKTLALTADNVLWSLLALQTWYDVFFGGTKCVF